MDKRKKNKDRLSLEQRSYCMSRVRSKDTKVEMLIRSSLFVKGYRFRKHSTHIIGKPDIIFPSKKVVVFIDGDFWHGRNFNSLKIKLSPFWKDKIEKNIKRDKKVRKKLRLNGWTVIRVWEKSAYKNLEREISKIEKALASNS